jgi:hypothetical protein
MICLKVVVERHEKLQSISSINTVEETVSYEKWLKPDRRNEI